MKPDSADNVIAFRHNSTMPELIGSFELMDGFDGTVKMEAITDVRVLSQEPLFTET